MTSGEKRPPGSYHRINPFIIPDTAEDVNAGLVGLIGFLKKRTTT